MRKQLFAILLILCLGIGLCACDNSTEAPSNSSGPVVFPGGDVEKTKPNLSGEETSVIGQDATFPNYDGLIIEQIYAKGNSWEDNLHFTVLLTCLDIDTGVSSPVSSFDFDIGYEGDARDGYVMPHSGNLPGQTHNRGLFSKNYDKLALGRYSAETGMTTVGWMDSNGDFFDIVDYLGIESTYGFMAVGFYGDYYVYGAYTSEVGSRCDYYYVPVSDVRKETVVYTNNPAYDLGVKGGGTWSSQRYQLCDSGAASKSERGILIMDKTPNGSNFNPIFKPENYGCRNGIGSPDETQLAFLMWVDEENDLFDIYITGMEDHSYMRKVEITDGTEYRFSVFEYTGGTGGRNFGAPGEGLYACWLIDWEGDV